ncbi:hypothetical protein EV122DRAFT_277825 [Schizophyllum commune]
MAPTADATPAAGQAKSKSQMRVINDYKEFKDSPAHATAKNRIKNIRQRLDDLIGLKVGAISNAVTAPWALHAIHIVTRTLKKENELVHECFRKAVGVKDEDGVPQINLDGLGNVEYELVGVHVAVDGPPWASKKAGYGKGDIAFLPKECKKELKYIEKNRGKDYKKLYPMKDGPREFVLYGFPNKHQHVVPRYSNMQRTYRHSLNRDDYKIPDDLSMPEEGTGLDDDACNNDDDEDDDVPPENTLRGKMYREYMQAQQEFGKVQHHVVESGINEWATFISHLNPVFVIFDYAYKMWYRIDRGQTAGISAEDLAFFHNEVWPVVAPWFTDSSTDAASRITMPKKATKPNIVAAKSAPEVASKPAVPARARLAKTAPVYNCDTSSPLTDFESSPSGPDTSTAVGPQVTKRILRPLKKPDFQNTAHSSSDAGPSSPPSDDREGPVEDAALWTTRPALVDDQDCELAADSATSDKHVRFASVAEHDDGEPEERTDENVEQPAQAASTTPESSAPQATSESQPPSIEPPAAEKPSVEPLRRTTRTNAGRPPKPLAPLTQATSKHSVPNGARSGNSAAAGESSTAAAASLPNEQTTSSSNDPGPSRRPSRAKTTGDKRTRDDDEEDGDDDEDDDESDGSEFLPTRRARKKVKAQDSNKPPARASSKGASKKGGKSGK